MAEIKTNSNTKGAAVDMQNEAPPSTVFWVLGVVFTGAEAVCAWLWFSGTFEAYTLLMVHTVLTAVCYAFIKVFLKKGAKTHYQLLLIGMAMFGFIGAISVLAGVFLTKCLDRMKPAHFDETFDDLFEISPEGSDLSTYRHIEHYDVVSTNLVVSDQLIDMFKFGSDIEKQNVLSVVNSNYQPKFARIIRLALQDTNNVIRIQAAAILADQEQKQQQKLIELEAAVKDEPTIENKLALAQHYDNMAHSGVTDNVRKTKLYSNAAAIYEDLIKENKSAATYEARLARIYYRLGKTQEAVKLIEAKAQTLEDLSLSLWYLELLFVNKNLKELREFAAKVLPLITGNDNYPVKLQGAVNLWATSHQ